MSNRSSLHSYLEIEFIVIARPLMEPSLSKVTELLMKKKMEEYPTLKKTWMMNTMRINSPQSSQTLWKNIGIPYNAVARQFGG